MKSQKAVSTIPSGYGLAGGFVGGNNHALIVTKTGGIELFDLAASECIQQEQVAIGGDGGAENTTAAGAETTGELSALDIHPDETLFCTGGSDKHVKFWELCVEETIIEDNTSGAKKTANLRRQKELRFRPSEKYELGLQTADEISALKWSPDGKWLAVGLMDSTVSLHYADTLKFSLSCYGHTLPIFCLDFSSDSQLLATGSADKQINLWSPTFGNCHKSMLAHDAQIMQVKFVRDTHYLCSVSKDGTLKFHDCDLYQTIAMIGNHLGEIWGLALRYDTSCSQFI